LGAKTSVLKKFLRRIILITNLAIALLLVLSFLSRYISPSSFWPPAFLGLAYPYFLAANILFILFWLLRRRKEFLISFLAVLVGWHTVAGYFSLHPGPRINKKKFEQLASEHRAELGQLKVLSFNVRSFDRYRWAGNPATRKDILRTIQEEDADIVCIQEFFSSNRGSMGADEIFRDLQNTPNRHLEYAVRGRSGHYGIATFSSWPIVNSGRIRFDNTVNISIYSDIRIREDTLRVYNNHLQSIYFTRSSYRFLDSLKLRYDNEQLDEIKDISFHLRDAFVKRAEQADIIAEHMAECPYRMIVCGDFNDTPVSYAYYRLSREMEDAFTRAGWGTGRTYIGKFPSYRIDYILYSGGIEALFFTRKKVRLSDHFPIISYLQIL
jgi:endonuclease/exonuclease/phosphatase family metal-dependent hydrolase